MNAPVDDLRHPRDLGQIIDTSLRLYRRNFAEFLAISAVALPAYVVIGVSAGTVPENVGGAGLVALAWIPLLVLGVAANAAIMRSVGDIADGLRPDFNRSYREVLGCLGALLLVVFLLGGIAAFGLLSIVGIPIVVYLWVRWFSFPQAIVIEHNDWKSALSLSAHIVSGSWWRTFGVLIAIWIIAFVPSAVVGTAFSRASPIGSALIAAVTATVVLPFSATAETLLFFDLQSRER